MSDPFVAEIRIVGFNFPPKGWAYCDGQLLPIAQNTALFSLLGTTYGGDGKAIFALPDLQGRAAMGAGQGPGLSDRFLGEEGGSETVTLLQVEMPGHNHAVQTVAGFPASSAVASAGASIARSSGGSAYTTVGEGQAVMAPEALQSVGSTQPHNNMMPYLAMNAVIALQGVFPQRT